MEDKEAIYDEQIAPLMTQLLEICQREGVPMFASFQYSEDGFCTSAQSNGHCVFDHYRAMAQCAEHGGVNVDKYMNWVAKDARKNGHSSIYLKMSGVPEVPPNTRLEHRGAEVKTYGGGSFHPTKLSHVSSKPSRGDSALGPALHHSDLKEGDELIGPDGEKHEYSHTTRGLGRMKIETRAGYSHPAEKDGTLPGWKKTGRNNMTGEGH